MKHQQIKMKMMMMMMMMMKMMMMFVKVNTGYQWLSPRSCIGVFLRILTTKAIIRFLPWLEFDDFGSVEAD